MKSTPPPVWKEAQKRWIREYKSDNLVQLDPPAASTGNPSAAVGYTPPSPERFFAETRLLAMESLNTAWLCEKAGSKMSDAQRTIMRLTYVTGLMEDHIADQMGLSEEAVSQLKRRTMALLRTEAAK